METPRLRYLPQLDGLRALAIVMVFLHRALNDPLLWAGMDLLFILSGYLITSILLQDCETLSFREMLKRFYVRRAERILPAYVLFVLVAAWFAMAEWKHDWPYYVFFLQNVPYAFHAKALDPLTALWPLAVEEHFYLVWPVLIFFLPRRWLAPCMLVVLVGTPILRAVCTPYVPASATIYAFTPFRLDALAAGGLAALVLPYCNVRRATRTAKAGMVVGVVAYSLLAWHHPWFSRGANSAVFNALAYSLNIVILGGLFVWVLLGESAWLTRVLASRAPRWLGRVSYSFYLFHLLILMEFQKRMGRWPMVVLGFGATLAVASASWLLLEKPVLSLSASHRKS